MSPLSVSPAARSRNATATSSLGAMRKLANVSGIKSLASERRCAILAPIGTGVIAEIFTTTTMSQPLELHEDRLFPVDPTARGIARRLYSHVRSLPIISPHGHTDPRWFADNAPFANAAELLLAPD